MTDSIQQAATKLAESTDTDILLYTGNIERGFDDKLLDMLLALPRRKNVLLLLCSNGGNPDAAYRIARGLQELYDRFTVLLAGRCKSAGTLLALGAHEIVMTAHAELGPLDIQLGKKDELFELDSGLTVLNALTELEGKAFDLFEKALLRIKIRSSGSVTFKTATHIATELAKGIVAPVMAQIDPMHVGEVSRALKIGKEYGERLSGISENLQEDALDRLIEGYPSHAFVIDHKEAKELFVNVRSASAEEAALINLQPLSASIRRPEFENPIFVFLSSTAKVTTHDTNHAQNSPSGDTAVDSSGSADEAVFRSQEQARPTGDPNFDTGARAGAA